MSRNPTLDDLRSRVFKHSAGGPEIGSWTARKIARPWAIYGTWVAVRLSMSAHAVTLASLVSAIAGTVAIGCGTRTGFVVGVTLLLLAYWLDHVDGQVARWRRTASLEGVYFDYMMHHAQTMTLGFALGFGLAVRTGFIAWTVCGFCIATGWTFLNLHNDCRYKAFFQKLKRDRLISRVDAATHGQFVPPQKQRETWIKSATWLAQKCCEPHVVLVGLVLMAIFSIISEMLWSRLWQTASITMAVLAPTLAVGRVAKAIRRRSIAAEFVEWFPSTPTNEKTSLTARSLSAARDERSRY